MKNKINKKDKNEEQKFLVGIRLGLIVIAIACGIAAVAALVFVFRLLGNFTTFAFVILLIAAVIFVLLGFGCFSYYFTMTKDGITKTRFRISVFKKWEELEFEIRMFEKSGRVFIDFFEDENQQEDAKLTFCIDKKFAAAIKQFAPDEMRQDIEEKFNYITSDENFPDIADEDNQEATETNIATDDSKKAKISEERISGETKVSDTGYAERDTTGTKSGNITGATGGHPEISGDSAKESDGIKRNRQ